MHEDNTPNRPSQDLLSSYVRLLVFAGAQRTPTRTFDTCDCAGGAGRKVVSADRHVVRVWDASTGAAFTSIQPAEPGINDVLHWPGSGLLMLGMDAPKIEVRRPNKDLKVLKVGRPDEVPSCRTGFVTSPFAKRWSIGVQLEGCGAAVSLSHMHGPLVLLNAVLQPSCCCWPLQAAACPVTAEGRAARTGLLRIVSTHPAFD